MKRVEDETDIAIVGGGLAGQLLSVLLSRRGISHRLLVRDQPERGIELGETLPPSTLQLLADEGLLALFQAHARRCYGYHAWWAGQGPQTVDFFGRPPVGHGLKLNKHSLVEALRQQNRASQRVIQAVRPVQKGAKGCVLELQSQEQRGLLRAGLVVDATGRNRSVLRSFGGSSRSLDRQLAFTCHVKRVRVPGLRFDVCTERLSSALWGIASALDDRRTALTLFCPADHPALPQVRDSQCWPELLASSQVLGRFIPETPHSRPEGRLANSSRARDIQLGCCLAVGDAALAFDPLSSHGISNAVFSVVVAAEAIESWRRGGASRSLPVYVERMERIFAEYERQRAAYLQEGAHDQVAVT